MGWICATAVAVCLFTPSVHVSDGKIDVMIARPDGSMLTTLHVDCMAGSSTVAGQVSQPFVPTSFADQLCTTYVGRSS